MITVRSLAELATILKSKFERYPRMAHGEVIGLIFAQGDTDVAAELTHTSRWEYMNQRTEVFMDFYMVGYTYPLDDAESEARYRESELQSKTEGIAYDPDAFVKFVNDLEAQTGWRFPGTSVIFLRASQVEEEIQLEFGDAIQVLLDDIGIEVFFERIIAYARGCGPVESITDVAEITTWHKVCKIFGDAVKPGSNWLQPLYGLLTVSLSLRQVSRRQLGKTILVKPLF